MLDDIQYNYAVDIEVKIQPTHTFDFNAQDALYHSELKRLLRQGLPRGDNDLKNKFQDAVNKISLENEKGSEVVGVNCNDFVGNVTKRS